MARRLRTWAGLAAGAALAPGPAYAAGVDAAAVTPCLGLLLAVAVIAAAWLWRRGSSTERERRRLAAALAAAAAAEATGPTAFYRWSLTGDGERFVPGAVAAFAGVEADFEAILARVDEAARGGLREDVARLRRHGTPFDRTVPSAAGGAFDAIGRRVDARAGGGAADIVWFADASKERAATAARDAAVAESRRLRELLDAVPVPIWRRRASNLALVDCNHAYAAALDSSSQAVVRDGIELAGGQRGRDLAGRARDAGAALSEKHHVVVIGSRRLVEFTEAPGPRPDEMVGWARDLTDLESAQGELSRHIAAHADVLENVATAIAIYGPDSRLKFFNTAFAALWRLEEEWLAGEPSLDEVLERLRERRRLPEHADFRAFKKQQRAMFTSLIDPQEELLHLPDERTLRLVVSPHPFGGLTFVYEDVTDKLALERSYNTLIEVQRETLDNLYEGVAVFGSDGRLKLSNPNYGEIWKLSKEDLTGEPHVSEIVEKTRAFFDDGKDWPSLRQKIINRVTSYTVANGRLERRDGSVLQVATVPLPDGNVLLTYLDITDSTRVQRALQERNDALETAGRLKSEFIANVSYELRTPLNAIIGFAEILTNQYFGELNPRQLDYSGGILDSSHRLLSLINDILDLATIEAGYMTLETEQVDIHSLMASVLALTRERARKQNLNLEFNCPPDVGSIVADERRLKQALFNLISNAIKFTPSGGTITLGAERQDGEVMLVVADTGVGIPREHQERVFEKFERGSPHVRQSGAGLGLSLVKSFIELHGGRVEMSSEPGSGTRVTCWLPATARPAALEPPPRQISSAG